MVYVAEDVQHLGYIEISDKIKPTSKIATDALHKECFRKTILIAGDFMDIAKHTGNTMGIDQVYANLLSADIVPYVEQLLTERKN